MMNTLVIARHTVVLFNKKIESQIRFSSNYRRPTKRFSSQSTLALLQLILHNNNTFSHILKASIHTVYVRAKINEHSLDTHKGRTIKYVT